MNSTLLVNISFILLTVQIACIEQYEFLRVYNPFTIYTVYNTIPS
jgi:hypothetical protein